MFIVSDTGQEMVNSENVFSFVISPRPDGVALIAFGIGTNQNGPIFTPLTIGSKERCEQALAAVRKGIKDRQHIVDLLGLLGQRPDLAVPQMKIVLPGNGDGQPS